MKTAFRFSLLVFSYSFLVLVQPSRAGVMQLVVGI